MKFELFTSDPDGVISSYSYPDWWAAKTAYEQFTEAGSQCLLLVSSPGVIDGISQKILNLSKNGAAH